MSRFFRLLSLLVMGSLVSATVPVATMQEAVMPSQASLEAMFSNPVHHPQEHRAELSLPLHLIDDGDTGFKAGKLWQYFPLQGFNGDFHVAPKQADNIKPQWARWKFENLEPGVYQVFATWKVYPYRGLTQKAHYTLQSTKKDIQHVYVNQQETPDGPDFFDHHWESLGHVTTKSGKIKIRLSSSTEGHAIADAIYLVRSDKADLSTVKTVTSQTLDSSEIVFTIDVKNAGPHVARSVTVADKLPLGLTFNPEKSDDRCKSYYQTYVACFTPKMGVEEEQTFQIAFNVDSSLCGEKLTNRSDVISHVYDPDTSNNQSSAEFKIHCNEEQADLSVTSTHTEIVHPGAIFNYDLLFENRGPNVATNVFASLVYSNPRMQFIQWSSDERCRADTDGISVKCALDTLSPWKEGTKVHLAFFIPEDIECSANLIGSAVVQSYDQEDPNIDNNRTEDLVSKVVCDDTNPYPVCGDNICEDRERDPGDPGGCGPNAPPECLGPPATINLYYCPEDCEEPEPQPVCGNNICEHPESAFGCDPWVDENGEVSGCENHTFCPEDCSEDIKPIQPVCPEVLLAEPPEGCYYEWTSAGNSCPEPILVCEEESNTCPDDAKICPDGSFVTREGPDCKFSKCQAGPVFYPRPLPAEFMPMTLGGDAETRYQTNMKVELQSQ